MSGRKIIEGAEDALAVAKGEKPAPRIWHNGHWYVPEAAVNASWEAAVEACRCNLTDQLAAEELTRRGLGDDAKADEANRTSGWIDWTLRDMVKARRAARRFTEPESNPQNESGDAENSTPPLG